MQIDNLILEITRKCNFTCEHCLRGNTQKKNIDFKVIDSIFDNNKNLDFIGTLTFSGGEPSLNVKAIDYFIEKCKINNVEIGNFYIATNGGKTSGHIDFLQVLIKLFCFCSDNEISQVQISKSDFHENQQDKKAIEKLKCLSFVGERQNLSYDNLIHEGNAKELNELNGTIDNARKIKIEKNLLFENDCIYNDELYINCKGDVVLSCNVSYKRQDKNKIGNVKEKSLMEMIK